MSKVLALIPVSGRHEVLKWSLTRLQKQTVEVIPLCCGSSRGDKELCESVGAEFYKVGHEVPLGGKWQHLVDVAKKKSEGVDAIMIMGTSQFFSHDWCEKLLSECTAGVLMNGIAGLYYYDIGKYGGGRMFYWPGYITQRMGEPVGAGRIIPIRTMKMLKWDLFDRKIRMGCDGSTMKRMNKLIGKVTCTKQDVKVVRVSTWKYKQINSFNGMGQQKNSKWMGEVRMDHLIDTEFPEVRMIDVGQRHL